MQAVELLYLDLATNSREYKSKTYKWSHLYQFVAYDHGKGGDSVTLLIQGVVKPHSRVVFAESSKLHPQFRTLNFQNQREMFIPARIFLHF
jgi:hypothetical protein